MVNYSYISIPTSRLTVEWLTDNGFSTQHDIGTFICYHSTSEVYVQYVAVEDSIHEFICKTQDEFIQKVEQIKLLKLL